jgi:hypothetical protein
MAGITKTIIKTLSSTKLAQQFTGKELNKVSKGLGKKDTALHKKINDAKKKRKSLVEVLEESGPYEHLTPKEPLHLRNKGGKVKPTGSKKSLHLRKLEGEFKPKGWGKARWKGKV